MSSFYGLQIAKTGLFVSQRGLNLTGHNISNVNTAGYTRQRIVSSSIDPASMLTFFAPVGKGKVGGGVTVQSVDQIRNSFIDRELRREYADLGMLESKQDTLIYTESIFNETSNSSISKTMSDFFKSLQTLSQDAASKELRTNVRQNAIKMTESFNHYYKQLLELQKVQNDSMKVTVDSINDIFENISDFNQQIFVYELSGEKANDLRDKRNLLIDQVSQLIDIEYSEDPEGRLSIFVGGEELVFHDKVTKITAVADQPSVSTGQTGFYSIYVAGDTSRPLKYTSGELEAYRQMRDGNTPSNVGIPRMIENLNTLVQCIAKEFNAIHSRGFTIPHDTLGSEDGINFFNIQDGDYSKITAANFRLSDEVYNDAMRIACSSVEIDLTAADPKEGNNEIIRLLAELTSKENLATVKSFEGYMKDIVIEIGVESAHVQKLYESQDAVVANLEMRKESISGVSLDEEVMQMMTYQHMYAASSRMITAIDEALDIIINRTGLVGRA